MLGEIKTLKILSVSNNKIETVYCVYNSDMVLGLYGIQVFFIFRI
jgi:hypothetical protein